MPKFDVKQADLTIEGHFEKPDLALLRGPGFVEHGLAQFAKFGLTPGDVTFGSVGSLADRNALLFLPRLSVGVKATVSKLEVGFNNLGLVTYADVRAIAVEAFDVLAKSAAQTKVVVFGAILNVHGIVEGVAPIDFLKGHMGKPPAGLGASTGGAAGFYFGEEGPRSTLALILDGSAVHAGAVYLRITVGFDGRKIGSPAVFDTARDAVRKSFAALSLQPTTLDLG